MAEIKAFKGFRYALSTPTDLGRLAAPPYDMIDDDMIDALYAQDPSNVVRLIQNRKEPTDTANKDRHVRAASFLTQWIKDGTLHRDDEAAVYVYRQTFSTGEGARTKQHERTGVVVLTKLTDFSEGVVKPHENTLWAPKADRYENLTHLECNEGIIFGIVPDTGSFYAAIKACGTGNPVGDFTDKDAVRHMLYKCTDAASINTLIELAKPKTILIADGHHRYETAVRYGREKGDASHSHVMMTLVSMADPGLVIRPFHRLIRTQTSCSPEQFLNKLSDYFSVTKIGTPSQSAIEDFVASSSGPDLLYCHTSTKTLFALTLLDAGTVFLQSRNNGQSAAWNKLNVSIVNTIAVGSILLLPLNGETLHDVVRYEKIVSTALEPVLTTPDYYGAFFLRSISIESIDTIVDGGERMPQKSTNFFPKYYSGLVFNKLDID